MKKTVFYVTLLVSMLINCFTNISIAPLMFAHSVSNTHYQNEDFDMLTSRYVKKPSLFNQKVKEWNIDPWIVNLINNEFYPYEGKGINHQMVLNAWSVPCWYGLKKVKFINGEVFANGPMALPIKDLLLKLHEKWGLPNLEFVMNDGDGVKAQDFWPPIENRAPVLSRAKVDGLNGVIPFIDFTISSYEEGDKSLAFAQVDQVDIDWDSKENKVFWRGSLSDGLDAGNVDYYSDLTWGLFPRSKLIDLSTAYPEEIDAAHMCFYIFNYNQTFQENHPPSPSVNTEGHLKYKYQIAIDGNLCTYPGFQWRLYSRSLCLKQISNQYQWYYPGLKPYVHYVPIEPDLSDLISQIHWCRQNDVKCQQIAENASAFANKYLTPDMNLKYAYLVLIKYAELQRFTPQIESNDNRL